MLNWHVYVIRSLNHDFTYVGLTSDLKRRIQQHQEDESQSTKHYRPFSLEMHVGVKTYARARELERYFKTGSGRAILYKRFLS